MQLDSAHTRTEITISYKKETPTDIICLSNQKCVVAFQTACLIFDLDSGEYSSHIFKHPRAKRGIYYGIMPRRDGGFCVCYTDELFFVDKDMTVS